MRPATDVDAFPKGASPFGVFDLEGNISQWTDEYRDEHTRAAIIRGGAFYQPSGSIWYFPRTYRLAEHQKYLLMSPGRERSGTIGCRCVVGAKEVLASHGAGFPMCARLQERALSSTFVRS